jgi:hypothetical protein
MNRPAVPNGNYPDASLDGWNIGNIHASGYINTVTPKQIIYSDHAEWRLRTRRITDAILIFIEDATTILVVTVMWAD